ncbi:MAG TPA: hypothetical protein VI636_00070 [Candidatus Angelobacter sp.]
MVHDSERTARIVRFFLGQMPADERTEFERQFLVDDEVFEEIIAAENDLIYAYARGKLRAEEKSRFEAHFLSTPERRERVDFAMSLASYNADLAARDKIRAEPRQGSILPFLVAAKSLSRFVLVAVIVTIVFAGAWMIRTNRQLVREIRDSHTREQELRRTSADLYARLQKERLAAAGQPGAPGMPLNEGATLSLVLSADVARSGGQRNILPIARPFPRIILLLEKPYDDFLNYDVLLETVEGGRIWSKKNVPGSPASKEKTAVPVEMPAHLLMNGDYVIKLFGASPNGNLDEIEAYSFRVARR